MAELPDMGKVGYDKAIATFSPDGRLYQVEYAREAVKKGSTCVGVTYDGGVVLISLAFHKTLSPEVHFNEKIHKADDHIGIVTCGLIGDSRVMVDRARIKAQVHKMHYDEPIDVHGLAKYLADIKQAYTQYGGSRPIGTAFLIGGVNGKPQLFETGPDGAMLAWSAAAIGRGADKAEEVLEKGWKKGLNMAQGIELAVKALKKAESSKEKSAVELVVIDHNGFRNLEGKERTDALKSW